MMFVRERLKRTITVDLTFYLTMTTSITSRISSISQQLRDTKETLQGVAFDAKYVCIDEMRHVGWLKSSFQSYRVCYHLQG